MAITTSSDFSLWFSNTADKAPGTSGLSTGGLYINTADGKMWLATSATTKVALAVNAEEISVASTSGKKLYLLGSESSSGDQKLYSDSGIVYSSETSNQGLTVTGYLKCDSILDLHGSHPYSGNVPLGCPDNSGKFYWGTIGEIVKASQSISSGTKIGSITIGDRTTEFYAPAVDVENGSTVSASASYNSTNGISIGSITVDGSTTTLYSPKIVDSSNKTYVFAKYTPAAADNAYIVAVNSTTDGYYELRKFPGLEFVSYTLKTTHPLYIDEGATVRNDPLVVNTSVDTKKVRTLSNGSYTEGTAGQVLMSGGSDGDVYWSDIPLSDLETVISSNSSGVLTLEPESKVFIKADFSLAETSKLLDVHGLCGNSGQVLMSNGSAGGVFWGDLPESSGGSETASSVTSKDVRTYMSDNNTGTMRSHLLATTSATGGNLVTLGEITFNTTDDNYSTIKFDTSLDVTYQLTAGTVKTSKIFAPTSKGGSTYGNGTDGQVLMSGGSSKGVYWGTVSSGSSTDEKVKQNLETSANYNRPIMFATNSSISDGTAGELAFNNNIYINPKNNLLHATSISCNTLQATSIKAATTSGGTSISTGINRQVLRTNGSSVYWDSLSYTSTNSSMSTIVDNYAPSMIVVRLDAISCMSIGPSATSSCPAIINMFRYSGSNGHTYKGQACVIDGMGIWSYNLTYIRQNDSWDIQGGTYITNDNFAAGYYANATLITGSPSVTLQGYTTF